MQQKTTPENLPFMHEWARVLASLLPSMTPTKESTLTTLVLSDKVPCYMDENANLKSSVGKLLISLYFKCPAILEIWRGNISKWWLNIYVSLISVHLNFC